jgi:hypothetical protein
MPGPKTRPENNDHCFTGVGRQYWEAIADGKSVQGLLRGPDGSRLDLLMDSDGRAMNNGGMYPKQITRMPPKIYYRFFGTVAHNRFGAEGCMAGGWWIEADAYFATVALAKARDVPLNKAAQAMLVIPDGWHDCGYVGKAVLTRKLKAWVGKGKPATSSVSPYNPDRNPDTDPIVAPPPGEEVKQWFVPGDRALLGRFFDVQGVVQCIKKGVVL